MYTRDVLVPVDPDAISCFYRLEGSVDMHSEFAATVDAKQLDAILDYFCVEGTTWSISKKGAMTVPRSSLAPQSKVWYHFLKTLLLPSMTMHIVSKDCMLLLDSIIAGRPINVGKIINKELYACARKSGGILWFPALITGLCLSSGVPVYPTEERLSSRGAITTLTIAQMTQV